MRTSRRELAAFTSALTLGILACSERPRESRDSTEAITDTITTPTMRRDLSSDLRVAEQALQQVEDSVDAGLGPEVAIKLQTMKAAFVAYRKEQCARLKAVFKDGTFGPVAELECQIHLTDSRREFIEQHYDFVEKLGGRPRRTASAHESFRSALK